MKFITAEQFSKADKKVRDSIMEWWEPSVGDLTNRVFLKDGGDLGISFIEYKRDIKAIEDYNKSSTMYFPLLTVGQLIEFIEWKENNSFEITISCADAKNTLLESLWQTIKKVCK